MKKLIITAACVCLAMTARANETEIPGTGGIPDLTKGGVLTRINLRWAGPLGIFCGSWRPRGQKIEDVRQLQVLAIEKGSPADGVLKIDDVILGADGTGVREVPLFEGAPWPMIPLGDAVTEAEARNPAILRLLVWRPVKKTSDDERDPKSVDLRSVPKLLKPYTTGRTMTVTIKLETLGRYSDTAPYNCAKSENILRKGIKALYESNEPGKFYMGVLSLLAADDPTNPENGKYQAMAKEWVHEMIADEHDWGAWESGVKLIVLSEYYMKTKDEKVFPILVKRAEHHARGVSWFGTTGHKYADKKPDGSFGGRISGYGPINCSGTQGFLALALARHAGVNNPVVDDAIRRQRIFFGHWAFRSGMGYGEMPYAIAGGKGDNNGKHALTALALGLQDRQEDKAKYFSKMTALSTHASRQYAHGGPFFGQVWQPAGSAQAGAKAANLQFQEIRWHLDLKRSWDHSRIYDPTNNKYKGFSNSATALMFYALPLQQLYVTGRGQKQTLRLSDAEFKELQAVKDFDAGKADIQELIAELSRHQGMTRGTVADELVKRLNAKPDDPESATIIDQLVALAADSTATTSGRAGALTTLMFLKRKSGNLEDPQDLEMVKTMVSLLKDPDSYIRFGAARMMQAFHPNFSQVAIQPYANEIMDAIIAIDRPTFPLDEDDPVQWGHGEMGSFLFGTVLGKSLEGVDRQKLVAAIRSSLRTPNGNARNLASRVLGKLTMEEVRELGDVLANNIKIAPPANAMGGSGAPQSQSALAQHLFEEALPLSFIYGGPTAIKNRIHEKYGQAAFAMQSTPLLMEAFGDLMLAGAVFDANKVIEEMRAMPAPDGMAKLKCIDSVTASAPTLTLPAAKIELVVDATNYGCGESETTYTWRKVYGAGNVDFTPNASGASKTTTVSFADKKPGKYRFEVTMSDTLGYNVVRETVDVTLLDKRGNLPANEPPRAKSARYRAVPGLPLQLTLAGSDPDGDDLGFVVIEGPQHGTLEGVGGTLTYLADYGDPSCEGEASEPVAVKAPSLPSLDDTGDVGNRAQGERDGVAKDNTGSSWTDSFTFEAIDGQGERATGTVSFQVSDQDVGVAVYEGFDYPTGALHNQEGGSSFGFIGPWINSRGSSDGYLVKTAGKNASLSYAALPSTGGRFVKGQGHTRCSRRLDRSLLKKHNMLEPGGEMWFSFFFSECKNQYVDFSAREKTSFGVYVREKNASSGVYATINREFDEELNRNSWSRSAGLRFPEGPNMVVGRCIWGKTDEEPDTVEVYRVYDAPGYGVVIPDKPVGVTKGSIPQEMINALVIEQGGFESPLDEFRVGPTRHSVMVGTKPMGEKGRD